MGRVWHLNAQIGRRNYNFTDLWFWGAVCGFLAPPCCTREREETEMDVPADAQETGFPLFEGILTLGLSESFV